MLDSRGAEETAYAILVINKGLCIATYRSIDQIPNFTVSLRSIENRLDPMMFNCTSGGSRGGSGGSLDPPLCPNPHFLISYETEIIGLSETKLFHFHGIV